MAGKEFKRLCEYVRTTDQKIAEELSFAQRKERSLKMHEENQFRLGEKKSLELYGE